MSRKTEIKEQIEALNAELKDLDKFSKKGWYIALCNGTFEYLVHFDNPSKSLSANCFYGATDKMNKYGAFTEVLRKATDAEVFTRLVRDAKRRGFVDGVTPKCLQFEDESEPVKGYYYSECQNTLYGAVSGEGGSAIFQDGKWSDSIISKELYVNDYCMKQVGTSVMFGCARFQKQQLLGIREQIKAFNRTSNSNRDIHSIILDSDVTVTLTDLDAIAERIE